MTNVLCTFCRMEIPEGYFGLGAVADHEVWKCGELHAIELAHNTCALGKQGWLLGDAATR